MEARRKNVAAAAVLVLLLAACGKNSSSTTAGPGTTTTSPAVSTSQASPETGPIVVGGALSLTGFLSAFDVPVKTTFEIAMKKINAAGGIDGRQLELKVIDVKSDSTLAANVAQQLIDGGADILLATCDFVTGGPAITVAQDAGVLSFAPCGSDVRFGPLGLGNLDFSLGLAIPTESAAMAEYAVNTQGWKNAYVLTDNSLDYTKIQCQGFKERFRELGGKIVGEDVFLNSDQSIAAQASRIASLGTPPDVVVLCSYPPGGATAVLQLRQAGVDAPILGGFGMDGNYWVGSVPNLSNFFNVSPASIYGDDPDQAVNDLLAEYMKVAGSPPPTGAFVDGAATVQVIEKAYEIAGTTDGAAMAKALESLKDFPTAAGPITYDTKFHISLEKPVRIMEIEGGKVTYAATVTPQNVAGLVHE